MIKVLIVIVAFSAFIACSQTDESSVKTQEINPQHEPGPVPDSSDSYNPLQGTIEFKSTDGLLITADISEVSEGAPYILLCHQAGFSRGEYLETSKWFNKLGFNTLAIDQRSGKSANGVENQTANRANDQNLSTDYLDAEQDIRSSVEHISKLLMASELHPIYLLGSSYSASLVAKIAVDTSFQYRNQISGILLFSPGEYLQGIELSPSLSSVECPVFVTCAQKEVGQTEKLVSQIDPSLITFYKPDNQSIHGSRAIWESNEGYEKIRSAVQEFLK